MQENKPPVDSKQLEVNGVSFKESEIKSVTIVRGGKDIYIESP